MHKTIVKTIITRSLMTGMLVIAHMLVIAQVDHTDKGKRMKIHKEFPNDKYLPAANQDVRTSPAYHYTSDVIFTTQVNVDVYGNNILNDAANEPSIAIDPVNPDRMVIGWRQFDNVNSDFRQAGYGYSNDGGNTWTFPGVIDPGVFRSDPVLDSDADGNFYYNSLTVDDYYNMNCDVYKIDDGSFNWDNGTYAHGGDKQWMKIDKTGGIGSGNNYSFWSSYWSICQPGAFTRSTDYGNSYEDCVVVDGDPYWGTLAVGPDGELYLVGEADLHPFLVVKSTTAQDPALPVVWDFTSDVNLDGQMQGSVAVNPQGLMGQAWVDVDASNGPGHGNVYVLASVSRFSSYDPADVMFSRSTDGGLTWEAPVQINDDLEIGEYQWFGTMSVAPNGRIDVVWLDTRDDIGSSVHSALYYSYSSDQGETWAVNMKLSEVFDPRVGWPQQEKMGDYFHMISDNQSAHLAWANTLNGEQDVYYSRITPPPVGISDPRSTALAISLHCYPNPVTANSIISYDLPYYGTVRISLFNIHGKEVKVLLNKEQSAGPHNLFLAADGLPAGMYFCRLESGEQSQSIRLAIMK